MKKKIFLMLTLLVGIVSAKATNEVVVGDVTIPQGGSGVVNIELNNNDNEFTAYQFRLILPEGLNFVANKKGNPSFVAGDRYDDHSIQSSASGVFVCISTSYAPISGTSGSLLSVDVTASADVAVGTKLNVTLGEIEFSTSDSTPIPMKFEDVTFTVTIGAPTDSRVVLDETSTNAPSAATGVDVRVKRTIKANEWSTLCLPFAMSEAQVRAAFGEDVELMDFTGYNVTEDGDNIVGIEVSFTPLNAIAANHPCLIKVSSPISEFTVDGVDIDPEEEPVVATVKRTRKAWSELVGTYVAQTEVPEKTLFLSGGDFWYSAGLTKMKAFRAYFDFYDVLAEVDESYANIRFCIGGETTGIKATNFTKEDGCWYTLDGRRLSGKPAEKGVYIFNSKKVSIR